MATNDYTAGATRHKWAGSLQAVEDVLIFNLDTLANNQSSSDIAQCIQIRAGMEVLSVMVEVVTAEGATLTCDVGDGAAADGFIDGLDGNATGFKNTTFLTGSAVLDPISLLDGAGESFDITVTGAVVGDHVNVAPGVDLQELGMTTYVRAANTVEVRLQNESTATVDLASSTWRAQVWKSTEVYGPRGKLYTADDTLDVVSNNAAATAVLKIMARIIDWGLASSMP